MEILSQILIGVVVALVILLVAVLVRHKKRTTVAHCMASLYITPDEILKTFALMKPMNPTFANGLSYDDLKAQLKGSDFYLPQDLSNLSNDQISKLTESQINILSVAFSALMAKGTFSVEQITAMSPSQISMLSPFQLFMPSLIIMSSPKNPLSKEQMSALIDVASS
jgi:hypothetical protein